MKIHKDLDLGSKVNIYIADGNVRGVPLGIADCDQTTDFYYANESLGFYRSAHFLSS